MLELIGAGGIIGYIKSVTVNNCSINNCSNSGIVTAGNQQVGGIIGNQEGGKVENCSNYGNIEAKSNAYRGIVGGIVGIQIAGDVTNVYNSGNVKAGNSTSEIDAVGGIIGYQIAGNLINAYNKGTLEGGEAVGGIVGQKKVTGAIVQKTFYNTTESIKGIGSESDDTENITAINDDDTKTKKVPEIFNTLKEFLASSLITK